jgi:hypothetical protein
MSKEVNKILEDYSKLILAEQDTTKNIADLIIGSYYLGAMTVFKGLLKDGVEVDFKSVIRKEFTELNSSMMKDIG